VSRRAAAVPYLTEAVRLAPQSARAHAWLADALLWAGRSGEANVEFGRAFSLDPEEPHTLFIGGVLALIHDWDWARAEQHLKRAVRRDREQPIYPVVLAFVLSTAGRRDEAVRLLHEARERDPASAILIADIGLMYLYTGLPEQAAVACEHAATLEPDEDYAVHCALAAREVLGHHDLARRHAATLLERAGADPRGVLGDDTIPGGGWRSRYHRWRADRVQTSQAASPFGAALALAEAGRVAEAVAALRAAAARRDMGFVTITVDPRFAPLRGDSAFQRLAAKLIERGAAPPS
jgi:Flp pilus assembly protein TadD